MEVMVGKRTSYCLDLSKEELKRVDINLKLQAKEISRKVDLMIVIGDRNSIEANKLYEISLRVCNNAMLVQNKEDLYINYIQRFRKVGVVSERIAKIEFVEQIVEILNNVENKNCI